MGGGKARLQTYLIIGLVLIAALVIGNLAFNDPEGAKNGFDKFLGLPGWAFPPILLVVGFLVFYMGLRLETDWPEALGALLIASGVGLGEAKIGWDKFDVGGLFILPYVIPVAVFLVFLFYGMMKSR
jgi:hypothetical protein